MWRALRRSWKNDLRVVWYLVYHVLTFRWYTSFCHKWCTPRKSCQVQQEPHQQKQFFKVMKSLSKCNINNIVWKIVLSIEINLFRKVTNQQNVICWKNLGAKSMQNSYCDKISRKGLEKRFSKIRNSMARKIWFARFHSQPYIFALYYPGAKMIGNSNRTAKLIDSMSRNSWI